MLPPIRGRCRPTFRLERPAERAAISSTRVLPGPQITIRSHAMRKRRDNVRQHAKSVLPRFADIVFSRLLIGTGGPLRQRTVGTTSCAPRSTTVRTGHASRVLHPGVPSGLGRPDGDGPDRRQRGELQGAEQRRALCPLGAGTGRFRPGTTNRTGAYARLIGSGRRRQSSGGPPRGEPAAAAAVPEGQVKPCCASGLWGGSLPPPASRSRVPGSACGRKGD